MPEGIPKTDEEREETHQEIFDESAPEQRGGFGDIRNLILQEKTWEIILYLAGVIALVYVLFLM